MAEGSQPPGPGTSQAPDRGPDRGTGGNRPEWPGPPHGPQQAEGQALRTARELEEERRARRAAEGAEAASTRRAEAGEATVRTLEGHVATLRERLEEATEEETNRQAPRPRLVIEHPSGVPQREDADQLRLAADSRWLELDR